MCEIHPAVDATILAEEKKKQQQQEALRLARERWAEAEKERCRKRFKSTGKQLLRSVIVVVVFLVLLCILTGLDLMAAPLTEFITSVGLLWLAIQFGAWLQYVFCERGYLK